MARTTYAVGDAGVVRRKVGSGDWEAATSPVAANLRGVWVSPTGVVWVSGAGGNVYRSTDGGATWEDMEAPTSEDLYRCWGFDDDYFFVVGDDEIVLRWHDGAWTNIGTGFPFFSGFGLRSVWGLAPDALWVGGTNGRIFFWDGSTWVHRGFGTNTLVESVRGVDAEDVFAVGPSGSARKWDGTASTSGSAFSIQASGAAANGYEVWPTAADAIWIARQNASDATMALWDGIHSTTPTLHEHGSPGFRKHGVWGFDATLGYAVGVGGNIITYNGTTWTHETSGTSEDLWAVHGAEVDIDPFAVTLGPSSEIPAHIDRVLRTGDYVTHARVLVTVGNPTAVNLSDLEGRDFVRSIEWEDDIDNECVQATITIRREDDLLSLAPWKVGSKLNRITDGTYVPTLKEGRAIEVHVAVTPEKVEPAADDWIAAFKGRIDSVEWGREDVELTCRDDSGRLQDVFVEEESEYGAEAGRDVELVMADILEDWADSTELRVVGDPEWAVKEYRQEKMSVMRALKNVVAQFGWVLGQRWDDTADEWKLTLLDPVRNEDTPKRTFGPSEYLAVEAISTSIEDIRNAVKVSYHDPADLEPDGEPKIKSVTATDSESVTEYGRRWMEIVEGASSLIDTAAEATRLAGAAVSDLAFPKAEQSIRMPLYPFVQPCDLYEFLANGTHYDTDQEAAVVGYRHSIRDGRGHTTIIVRGNPIGGSDIWIERGARPGVARPKPDKPPAIVLPDVSEIPGGIRVEVPITDAEWRLRERLDVVEVHVGAGDFTPSSDTLVARGRERSFDLFGPSLPIGEERNVKVVAVDRDGNRSLATAGVAGRAGRVGSQMLVGGALSPGLFPGGWFNATSRG